MGTYTAKKGLYKPDVNETGWGSLVSSTILDLLDRLSDLFGYRAVGTTLNRWYTSMLSGAALTTVAPTANVLRAFPFLVPNKMTLDQIAVNVTTLTAGKQRLGIYSDNGSVGPGALLLDAGEVDTGTTGVKAATISQAIPAGTLLWLAVVGNAAPTVRALPVGGGIALLGLDSTLGTNPGIGWTVAYTYGTLPATFPGSPTVIDSSAAQPAIFVRASA